MKKATAYFTRKDELRGRILFSVLMLFPVITAFVINYPQMKSSIIIFASLSVLAIFINLMMSKHFRKNNSVINDETAQRLIQDKDFQPAMTSRVITFLVSFVFSVVFAVSMRGSEILHPIMFFLIGYIFFTMIQFKRL